jgi:hypothetical protein
VNGEHAGGVNEEGAGGKDFGIDWFCRFLRRLLTLTKRGRSGLDTSIL